MGNRGTSLGSSLEAGPPDHPIVAQKIARGAYHIHFGFWFRHQTKNDHIPLAGISFADRCRDIGFPTLGFSYDQGQRRGGGRLLKLKRDGWSRSRARARLVTQGVIVADYPITAVNTAADYDFTNNIADNSNNARQKGEKLVDTNSSESQEEQFYARPSVRIPVPDHLKALLVDDWENITKNQQLVPIPHEHPVTEIINDYLEHERPQRLPGSAQLTILEETMSGMKTYFDMAIGRVLLYRFERPQYREIHKMWTEGQEKQHTCASDTYGPEHLSRLIVTLPELIAQTNMDQQSVSRLKEELVKFAIWLAKNAHKYFAPEYESPTTEYVDKSRMSN